MGMTTSPLLEIQEATVHYGTGGGVVRALEDVSISLKAGEAVGIVGESGSGKTSLALYLMRLLPRNAILARGRVLLEGSEVSGLSQEEYRRQVRWRRIAMVFQGAMEALNPVLRVGPQVAEPLLLDGALSRREVAHRVQEALEQVGLSAEIYDRYPHELSGGMKQRVLIAMALVMAPQVVILDEPTSALDVSIQAQIMNLLKDLKVQLGLSVFLITHDIALASDLADRIGVLYAGRLVEWGPADEVLLRPQHPYTEGLMASLPRLRASEPPLPIRGVPPDPLDLPSGCPFHPRCPYVLDRCREEVPPHLRVGVDHEALCWLREPTKE
jgi:oligopeptide/dipeptide ABC transporter ATP-binding protein